MLSIRIFLLAFASLFMRALSSPVVHDIGLEKRDQNTLSASLVVLIRQTNILVTTAQLPTTLVPLIYYDENRVQIVLVTNGIDNAAAQAPVDQLGNSRDISEQYFAFAEPLITGLETLVKNREVFNIPFALGANPVAYMHDEFVTLKITATRLATALEKTIAPEYAASTADVTKHLYAAIDQAVDAFRVY